MTIDYAAGLTIDARPVAHGWRAATTVGKITFSVDRPTETEARARLVEVFEDAMFGFDRYLARALRAQNANVDA